MSQKPFLKSRFFKLPQHKIFDFPARYYDERKERVEKTKKMQEADNYSQRIKKSFANKNDYDFLVRIDEEICCKYVKKC